MVKKKRKPAAKKKIPAVSERKFAFVDHTYVDAAGDFEGIPDYSYSDDIKAIRREFENRSRAESVSDTQPSGATRFDDGKLRLDLLPFEAIAELARVCHMGAFVHDDHNWRKGMKFSRAYSALMRHALKFWLGEEYDTQTKCHHMAHAAWNALALVTYCYVGASDMDTEEMDDRPSGPDGDFVADLFRAVKGEQT